MTKASIEKTVGTFVIIGLVCIGFLSVKFGKMELFGTNFTTINARFDSVSGLQIGSSVNITGVKIGRVKTIIFDNFKQVAVVEMKINKEVYIDEDTTASIKTSGLIGNKYIELTPGSSESFLKSGDFILETEPSIDIEELISKYLFGNAQ